MALPTYVNFNNALELLLFTTNNRQKTLSELTVILEEYFKDAKREYNIDDNSFTAVFNQRFLETIIFPIIKYSKNLYNLYTNINKIELLLKNNSICKVIPDSYFYNDEDKSTNYDVYPSELIEIIDDEKNFKNTEDKGGYILYKNFIAYFNLPTQDLTYTTFKNLTFNDDALEPWRIKINLELDNLSRYNNFNTLFELLIFVTNKRKRSLDELKVIIIEFIISNLKNIEFHEYIRSFYASILQEVKNINDLYNFINKITVRDIDMIIPIDYFYVDFEDGIINVDSFPKYLYTIEINEYEEEVVVFENKEDEYGYIVYKNYLKYFNITENDVSYPLFKKLTYNKSEDNWSFNVNEPRI